MLHNRSSIKLSTKGPISAPRFDYCIFTKTAFNVDDLTLSWSNSFNKELTLALTTSKHRATFNYHAPTNNARITLSGSDKVLGKQLEWSSTYNTAKFNASLMIDSNNRVYARVDLESKKGKLKYTHHTPSVTFEPTCYFVEGKHAYKFALSKTFSDYDILKASFNDQSTTLNLKWSTKDKLDLQGVSIFQFGRAEDSTKNIRRVYMGLVDHRRPVTS